MRNRMWPGLALLVIGCTEPVSPREEIPDPPQFESAPSLVFRRIMMLRGTVSLETTVRIYVDELCSGPVYRQVTDSEFQTGVEVRLVKGMNVFTANAVSNRGQTSSCSVPVRIESQPSDRLNSPSIVSYPPSPSTQTHFVVSGMAEPDSRVRFHDNYSCEAPVLIEVSAAEYAGVGIPVDVAVNDTRFIALDAVNELEPEMVSVCAHMQLSNDRNPPTLSAWLASPSPSPQTRGWIAIRSDDASHVSVTLGDDCMGPSLATCSGCSMMEVDFPPYTSTTFSVRGQDFATNETCLVVGEWVHDPSLPEEERSLLIDDSPVPRVQVPVGRPRIDVFYNHDCSGVPATFRSPSQLIGAYWFGLPDSGFLTVRSQRADGGLDPCSNAVELQP